MTPPPADFPFALEPFFALFALSSGDFRIQHGELARLSTKSRNRVLARTLPLKAVSGQKFGFEILCLYGPIRYAESENPHWKARKRRKRVLTEEGNQQVGGALPTANSRSQLPERSSRFR